MATFYIATKIERVKEHNKIRDFLTQQGQTITYDWTTHGSVKNTTVERLNHVAHGMIDAIKDADFVVVLLPGGRGTHTELGAALAAGKQVIIHSEDEKIFQPNDGTTAFYHHDLVTSIICSFEELEQHLFRFQRWQHSSGFPEVT